MHESTDRKLLKTYLLGNEEAAETTVCDRRTGFSTKKKKPYKIGKITLTYLD